MKRRIPALKLVRETVRELSGDELSKAAGGSPIPPSGTPTCYCVSGIPCNDQPSQLLNPCFAISGVPCNV